jgi:hypothetical protein
MKKRKIEGIVYNGRLESIVAIYPKLGKRIFIGAIPNLVVNVGIAQGIKLLGNQATDAFRYGAVGTGSTAPAVENTALEAEVDRQLAEFIQVTTIITDDTGKWVTLHTAPAGGWTLREYGLFTLAAVGIMFTRIVYGAITLAEGNQLEFSYLCQGERI